MAKFGCPAKFIAVVRQFHDDMFARVQNNGEFSDPFPVTNGIKQGRVLASTLFSMMFSVTLTDTFQDDDNGILIRYRFECKLFNLRRLQAKSKVQTEVLDEFLFADDMAKGVPTDEKMQKGVDQVSDTCDSYDLTISIKKTEVVYQPAPRKPHKEPIITVKGHWLQVVDKFTYLGSTLSGVVHIDVEVNVRIAKVSAAFGRLSGSIWDRSGIRLDTKLKVYSTYGAAYTIICMWNLDSLPTTFQKTEPIPYKLSWKTYQDHVARQDSRYRSPEKDRDAECTYSSEIGTVEMDRPCYQNDERLPKKILYG